MFEKPVELWVQLISMGGGSSVRQFPADKDSSGGNSPPRTLQVMAKYHPRLLLTVRSSARRHPRRQVRGGGDGQLLPGVGGDGGDVPGRPAGVPRVAHPERHPRGVPGIPQQASVSP